MVVHDLLRPHDHPLSLRTDLVVRHPFALLAWPVEDLLRLALELGRVLDQAVLFGWDMQKAVLLEGGELLRGEGWESCG